MLSSYACGRKLVLWCALLVVMLGLTACADKAEPKFRQAEQAEKAGKVVEAVALYGEATKADPSSSLGKKATEKVKELGPAAEAQQKRDDEEAAKRRAAEAAAAARALEALRAKMKREHTSEDDTCASKGKPPRSYRYTGGTYAENQSVAYGDGCVAFDDTSLQIMGHAQNHFCCR